MDNHFSTRLFVILLLVILAAGAAVYVGKHISKPTHTTAAPVESQQQKPIESQPLEPAESQSQTPVESQPQTPVDPQPQTPLESQPQENELKMVKLKTNRGDIVLKLDAEKAPITVSNFISYVESGHYDNTVFHRVIDNFMIQGGGFEPGLVQKKVSTPIVNEANNGLQNLRYTIAMARTSDPHSATAQFFINVTDNATLDFKGESMQGWGYAVFGEVVEGTEVVDEIKAVETTRKGGHANVPISDVIILDATVEN